MGYADVKKPMAPFSKLLRAGRRVGWVAMTLLAVLVAVIAGRYFLQDPSTYFQQNREFYADHSVRLLTHIGGGVVALLLGPFQFWGWFRNRSLRLHRLLGAIYLIASVGFGAAGALALAPHSYGGLSTHLGFGMLGCLWAFTGLLAYWRIMALDVRGHREWMIRSYALTFGAVTLRLWLPLLIALGFNFTESYQAVAWISWVPNLFVAELYIGATRPKSPATTLRSN